MRPPSTYRNLPVILALGWVALGCKMNNPSFRVEPRPGAPALDSKANLTTAPGQPPVASTPAPNTGSQPATTSSNQTTHTQAQDSTTGTQSTIASLTSSASLTDGSSEVIYPETWTPLLPTPENNLGLVDHCKRGAKGCFVFRDHTHTEIESQTPGYPGIKMGLANLKAPPAPASDEKSPATAGVRLNGITSRMESLGPFPRYAGQNFGIELWYRSDPEPEYESDSQAVMLFQVPGTFWIAEHPESGILSCGFPLSPNTTEVLSQAVGPTSSQARDRLRYVVCFIHNGSAFVYYNGTMVTKQIGDGDRPFQVQEDVTNRRIALGGWVQNNPAENNFQRFQGTIYMARIWNNIQYMQSAISAELKARGIDPKALDALKFATP